MFTQLATWYPILGKEAEMLAHGTEFVKARQAKGERYSLLTRLYSPVGRAITVIRNSGASTTPALGRDCGVLGSLVNGLIREKE